MANQLTIAKLQRAIKRLADVDPTALPIILPSVIYDIAEAEGYNMKPYVRGYGFIESSNFDKTKRRTATRKAP